MKNTNCDLQLGIDDMVESILFGSKIAARASH